MFSLEDAYKELGLNQNASESEVKSAFRKMAAQNHPDKFQDPVKKAEAEEKFKRINAANQIINNPEQAQNAFGGHTHAQAGYNVNDIFNNFFNNRSGFGGGFPGGFPGGFSGSPFQHQNRVQKQDVRLKINLTFEESVLGCDKTISYDKEIKCNHCEGSGAKPGPNKCTRCNGTGQASKVSGGVRYVQTCPACFGTGGDKVKCDNCTGRGSKVDHISGTIKVPPVKNGQTIKISGGGHYIGTGPFNDEVYSDLLIDVFVADNADMSLHDNGDVISKINISLLEALVGKKIDVATVKGLKQIDIKPGTKHLENIIISGCGAAGVKNHVVQVNVEYPTDTAKLVEFLKEGNS